MRPNTESWGQSVREYEAADVCDGSTFMDDWIVFFVWISLEEQALKTVTRSTAILSVIWISEEKGEISGSFSERLRA